MLETQMPFRLHIRERNCTVLGTKYGISLHDSITFKSLTYKGVISGHYDAKAFPSAGLMPFLQNYLCSFTNPCYGSPTTGDDTTKINSKPHKQSM